MYILTEALRIISNYYNYHQTVSLGEPGTNKIINIHKCITVTGLVTFLRKFKNLFCNSSLSKYKSFEELLDSIENVIITTRTFYKLFRVRSDFKFGSNAPAFKIFHQVTLPEF